MAALVLAQLENAVVTTVTPTAVLVDIAKIETTKTIASLPPGRTFKVYACEDEKSYFLYRVKLSDGRFGYVGKEPIYLKVTPAWKNFWKPPLVWNCY